MTLVSEDTYGDDGDGEDDEDDSHHFQLRGKPLDEHRTKQRRKHRTNIPRATETGFFSSHISYIFFAMAQHHVSRIEPIFQERLRGFSWISSIQPMYSIYNIYIARFCNRFAADGNMVGC